MCLWKVTMDDDKYTTIFHGVSRQLQRYFANGHRKRGGGRILLEIVTYCVAEPQEELTVFCVGFILRQDPLWLNLKRPLF